MTTAFDRLKKIGLREGDKNFCGVIAVAIATNSNWRTACDLLSRYGRRKGGSTPWDALPITLSRLGYVMVPLHPRDEPWISKCKTVMNVHKHIPRGVYLISTSHHILAVRYKIVHDWTAERRHRPLYFWRVLPREDAPENLPDPLLNIDKRWPNR